MQHLISDNLKLYRSNSRNQKKPGRTNTVEPDQRILSNNACISVQFNTHAVCSKLRAHRLIFLALPTVAKHKL